MVRANLASGLKNAGFSLPLLPFLPRLVGMPHLVLGFRGGRSLRQVFLELEWHSVSVTVCGVLN